LANSTDGLRVYDVSNPVFPNYVGHWTGSNALALCYGVAVSGNYVYLANESDGLRIFLMVPQLSIANNGGNNVLISWPVTPATFTLQQSVDISGANWMNVTNSPNVVGNRYQMMLPQPGGSTFYRLKFP
jgi:hypothetical protein